MHLSSLYAVCVFPPGTSTDTARCGRRPLGPSPPSPLPHPITSHCAPVRVLSLLDSEPIGSLPGFAGGVDVAPPSPSTPEAHCARDAAARGAARGP